MLTSPPKQWPNDSKIYTKHDTKHSEYRFIILINVNICSKASLVPPVNVLSGHILNKILTYAQSSAAI